MGASRFLLVPILAWSLAGQAQPFKVEYSTLKGPETNVEFESNLARAYSFVTARVPDQVNRGQCPIRVEFRDLGGMTGFTPHVQLPCAEKVYLDSSLERNWKAQVVFAHELVHLFRHQNNPHEELWLDEGCAKLMEVLYGGTWPDTLRDQLTGFSEFRLSNDPADYSARGPGYVSSYFLMQYLYSRLGQDEFLREVLTSGKAGWANIEESAASMGRRKLTSIPPHFLSAKSLWTHFAFALFFNDPNYAAYGLFLIDYNYRPISPRPMIGPSSQTPTSFAVVLERGKIQLVQKIFSPDEVLEIQERFADVKVIEVSF